MANVATPSTGNWRYGATALLNDSVWFSSAFAQREHIVDGMDCTLNQFALGLSTDLPHARSGGEPTKGITGCTDQCIPTQLLGFRRIPLAVGCYQLSDLKTCVESSRTTAVDYRWLVGGDIIINHFYPRGTTIRKSRGVVVEIPGYDNSWLEVTQYNPKTGQVEGTFEMTLLSRKGEIARFTKGSFRVTLTR
ncbi:hypothetical protein [Spirosoma gilvum]